MKLGHSDPTSWLTSFEVTAENQPVSDEIHPLAILRCFSLVAIFEVTMYKYLGKLIEKMQKIII